MFANLFRLSISSISILLLTFCDIVAQDLSAYNTPFRQFVIQDKYDQINAEQLPVLNFKVGRTAVAYNDNTQQFKIYYNKEIHSPTNMLISDYIVTDNLVAFAGGGVLNVFDQGETTFLSSRVNIFDCSDSIVFYNDEINQKVNAYYNGEQYELESFLSNQRVKSYLLGDNILGYINFANQFKIFYQGETQLKEVNDVKLIGAGRDILCYEDINGYLQVFYRGDMYNLDLYTQGKVWVGDRMVAFISSDGKFKLFYDGMIKDIGFFTPKEVGMQDFVFWYTDFNGYFQMFHEGEFKRLDTQYPETLRAKYNSILFRNRFDQLTLCIKGVPYNITTLPVKDLELYYDVVNYTLGLNTIKVFGEGSYN